MSNDLLLPKCTHTHEIVAKLINSIGTCIYGWHCQECGQWRQIKTVALNITQQQNAKPRNESIRKTYYQQQHEYYQQRANASQIARTQQQADWWQWYNEYLLAPAWRLRRQHVLDRDKNICQGCLSAPATQVHHLTYAHVGDELLFELVSVCDTCHAKIHTKGGQS